MTSENEVVTSTNCESGEFYLDMAEWVNITFFLINEGHYLVIGRMFTAKFQDLNSMSVIMFTNYCLKKPDRRKVNSPFFRARAVCKFDNYALHVLYCRQRRS